MFASPAKASGCIFEKHVNWTLAVAAAKTSKATLLLYNSIVIWNDLGKKKLSIGAAENVFSVMEDRMVLLLIRLFDNFLIATLASTHIHSLVLDHV